MKWLSSLPSNPLEPYKVYPNQYGANSAVIYGKLDILKWLDEHNIFPDK